MTAKESPVAAQTPMTTDDAREYLVEFMMQHFTDKTFHRYIRGQRGEVNLAGDFAWQMARALKDQAAPALPVTILTDEQDAFENYFCTTLSCDNVEPQSLIDACRVAACDAWMHRAAVALVASLEPQQEHVSAAPEGYAWVPLIPNAAMKSAIWSMRASNTADSFQVCYDAMLAAAPTPPSVGAVPAADRNAVPTGDELRAIVRSASTSASDGASPQELVLAGWRAAIKSATPPATAEQNMPGEPTEREALIACLGDDAAQLDSCELWPEMAQTMREAAAMLEADGAQPVAASETLPPIRCDWEPCNPACDFECNGWRSISCNCEAAQASMFRQRATPTGQSDQTKDQQ